MKRGDESFGFVGEEMLVHPKNDNGVPCPESECTEGEPREFALLGLWNVRLRRLRTEMDAPARCRSQLSARITIIRQDKDAVAEFISEPIMRTQTDVPEEPPRSQLCTQTTYNAFLLYSVNLCLYRKVYFYS